MESDEDVREVVKKAFSSKILLKGPFSTLPFRDITLWKTWNLEGQLIIQNSKYFEVEKAEEKSHVCGRRTTSETCPRV